MSRMSGRLGLVAVVALGMGLLAALPAADAALVGYWTFNDTLADASGNGNSGTIGGGAPAYSTNVPAAIGSGKSLSLNGSTDFVAVTPTAPLGGSFTVAAWVNVLDNGARNFFDTRRPSDCGFDAKLQGGTTIHGDIGSGGAWISTGADASLAYSTGTWYHVAYVVSPNDYTIYANGVQVGTGSLGINWPVAFDANHSLNIGRHSGGVEYFNGNIDDVAVWDNRLTPAQIAALAAGTSPTAIPTAGFTYIPISSDADSGISSTKTYTHALDFGTATPAPTINGVAFQKVAIANLPLSKFDWQVSSGGRYDDASNGSHNVTGNIANLMADMVYNGGCVPGGAATATVSGLIPGVEYDTRVYTRQWAPGGTRNATIGFDANGDGFAERQATINEDNAAASPPGFAAANQAYAISSRFVATGTQASIKFEQQYLGTSWHLYGLSNEFVRPTAPITAKVTADDSYSLYISGDDSQAGLLIGSGGGWETPETWGFDVPIGQPMYLHVVGANGGVSPSGILAQLESMLKIDETGSLKLYTDAVAWGANTTGFGQPMFTPTDLGVMGVGPWGMQPGYSIFDPGAPHWIWLGGGDRPAGETIYFTVRFTVTPEPGTLVLLGGGLLALMRRRRRTA